MTARPGRAARFGALGFTLLALALTGLTALLLARLMSGGQYAGEPTEPVVVARRTIAAAERINEDHLKVIRWPASAVPEGAFASIDALLGPDPRVPLQTVLAGEPVLQSRLASPGAGTGMASLVPPDLRAFPIPVDRWIADARLVYPQAVVDVLTTVRAPGDRYATTKVVLQNVRVLAVDGLSDAAELARRLEEGRSGGADRRSVVTLLVNPEEAEVLALASREGKVDLMLRNAGDARTVSTFGLTVSELLGEADPSEVEAALAGQRALERQVEATTAEPEPPRRRRRPRPTPPADASGTKTIRVGGDR
ncbi:MAG: Flp pilus assembly protein CpaB [Myxococcales bacterium]|nr:Flp pilus assembly protein CpaB [Myxococcales bacterium]